MATEMRVHTINDLCVVLDQVTWAPSCSNLEWKWSAEAVYSLPLGWGEGICVGWLVNAIFQRVDAVTGVMGMSDGWPVFVPIDEPETKVVKRMFDFCEQVLQHELREALHYKRVKVFDPHRSIVGDTK